MANSNNRFRAPERPALEDGASQIRNIHGRLSHAGKWTNLLKLYKTSIA
jgi:hypothetical protein